ncbi:hypothetical protein N0V90_002140 [Kalmusia sp. IMI 367209]|nr:hypothetical protein N0V90_002140 [Kalmusia sp. IMI 367209]
MNPTVVICPGAWPLVWFFQPLMESFEAQGYPAVCKVPDQYPTTDDPGNDLQTNPDTTFLRDNVLLPLIAEGKDVLLFMHSYGGVYGPQALKGLSKAERKSQGLQGGVVALIFVAAFVAPVGASAVSAMRFDPQNLPEWMHHDKATGLVAFKKDHAKAMLFHDLSDEEAERFADALPKQPWACFSTTAQWDPFTDPHFAGTVGYIYTEADRILPYEMQKLFAQQAHADKSTVLEGSSHSPHIERPNELASIAIGLYGDITH